MRQKKEENNMVIEQRPRYKKYKTSNYNSVGHKSSALPQNSISKLNMRKGSFHMNGSKRNTKNLENMKIRLCKKKSVVHQSYNNYYDSNKSINSISSINNLKLGHKSVSLSGNIRTDRSNSDALNSTGNTQHFQTNSLSNDLPFVLDGLQTGSKSRAQVFHFGSRGERTQPKAALNHTAVFLNKTGRLQEVCQLDEVPDENVDERSLSRIRDMIVNRGSITNRLHKSFENY